MEKELSCEVFDKILGIGSYGKVCEAKVGQLPCAAKLLHDTMFQLGRDDPGLRKFVQRFEQECEFLKQIKHPNIVQFLGTVRDPRSQRLTLLMELMDESLTRFLERSTGPLPYHTQLNICHDVALALAYLHSNDIIHRDLSSNNVLLIGEGSRAKVTDFGMYKLVGTNPAMTPLTTCPGTSAYMPPEALVTPPQYSDKLDCFSHGVLTIQVVTRKFPNPGDAHVMEASRRSFRIIPESERRKKQLDTVEPNHPLLPLALHCIEDIDKERPSADEICGRLALLRQESRFTGSMEQFSMRSLQVSSQQLQESVRRLQQELEEKDKIIAGKNEELMKTLANTETLEDAIAESRRELATKDSIIEQLMAENRNLLAARVKYKVEDTLPEPKMKLHKGGMTEREEATLTGGKENEHRVTGPLNKPQSEQPRSMVELKLKPGPTQQPIGLGQPLHVPVMQQSIPMGGMREVTQGTNRPVVYNMADTTVNPPSQRPRAPKARSHCIKIVDPNTKTEVKVGEPSEPPNSKETVAEFKNKVQSAVSNTGPLAGTTPEVGEGAQSQHRPQDHTKTWGVLDKEPGKVETAKDEAKAESAPPTATPTTHSDISIEAGKDSELEFCCIPVELESAGDQVDLESSKEKGPDHRKVYDRDFLLFVRDQPVCHNPGELLQRLISIDIYHTWPVNYPPPMGGSIRDRDRDYFGGGKNERRGGGGGRRGSQPKTISHQPTAEKVELRKVDQRWTRPVERMAEKTSEDGIKTEELYRRFQGILNKLTPQKFQALAEQALKLEITTEERLSGCVDIIFTRAVDEEVYSVAYANLCKVMSPIKVDVIVEEGKIKCTNFRRMLLTKCQHEFEKDKQDDATLEEMRDKSTKAESEKERQELKEELSLATTRMRKRSLGNIRFIGELFKLSMLSETAMHECITRLLKSTSDEESLECFGKLIMTTGKDLDRPEAKPRMDAYFRRIDEIIKKGRICARIKLILKDVQDLRDNDWVPRARQDKQLKTIDQIQEKEMIQQHQVIGYGRQGGGRGDSRRGSKADVDRGDRKEREKEKVDTLKLAGILSKRKEKGGAVSLGPSFRPPGGWRKGSAPATAVPLETSKSAKPSRSKRAGGPSGKGSGSGPKRSHTIPTPEQEREAALQVASHLMANKYMPSAAHAVRMERKPVTPAPVLDEATVQRKVTSIIDELVTTADLKEAVECVKEFAKEMMDAPKLMTMMVVEGINHTLEKKAEFRASAGRLFSKLVQDKVLTQQKFMEGLNEVLEMAEDYSIDIPKFWDYLGEVLAPVMAHSTLNLSLLSGVPPSLVESGMAAKLVAKVLQQCQRVLGSEEEVKTLWSQSRLNWETLGKGAEDLAEFLVDQNLGYLRVSLPEEEPAYLKELKQQLASDRSNEEVRDWIKANGIVNPKFMRHLTTATVDASVVGSGQTTLFNASLFEKRMELLKIYSLEGQGLEVLYALQVAVSHLSHPPKLLNEMFNLVYNTKVLSEDDFFEWEKKGSELYGRGNALNSVRSFFEWLKSSDSEDMQNAI